MKTRPLNRLDLLIGATVGAVFIFLSFYTFPVFESLEKVFYGIQMRLALPQSLGDNRIAIVNIDEKSLKQLGPWPWPRHIIADMITILKNNGARLIALDMLFSEHEQNQGLLEVTRLNQAVRERYGDSGTDEWLLKTLEEIERRLDNDQVLVQRVKESGNTILPTLGDFGNYETEIVLREDSFLKENTFKPLGLQEGLAEVASANQLTTPFEDLARSCKGLGHLNFPVDRWMRGQAHLPFINFRGHIMPSLPLRIALDYFEKQPWEAVVPGKGIRVAETVIPTFKGEVFIKFKGGKRSFPYYSFVDILSVKKVPAVFEDKIVLIGYTANGANSVSTPVDPAMPRVELIANVIEDLIKGRYLQRPQTMIYVEALVLMALSILAMILLPNLSFVNRLGATLGLLFLVLVIGGVAFLVMDTWFKATYISLSLLTSYSVVALRESFSRQKALGLTSKESIETNRMLGLSFQSQGLLDLAFEKFRKCPLDDAMKDVVYNLGLDYERKRMTNKAISVYEYITNADSHFRDLAERIPKLKKLIGSLALGGYDRKKEEKIVVSEDLETKPTVGRYEILKELGQGAMGIVYQARDPKINRLLAIKTIRFSDEFEEAKLKEVKERFLREAEIAGKLSHPSVVSIFDVGEDYDLTYLAMEFLEGEDLQRYCRKTSLLPLRRVLYIISETALALDYAHSQGVIHRDIKPGNIMLLKNGKIKVTDFGIAKAMSDSKTKSGIILGTPNYMSPEQINGEEVDGRSDIFSLGVVFFELLTGTLPFRGKSLTNLFYQITQAKHGSPRDINPRVPTFCVQIIDRALAKRPEKRFQSAGELARYIVTTLQKIDRLKSRPKG